ncbi:A disintegrin and metalloproteinase with thrombospondin motifs 17-like isoform X2 [Conger conger]|uniref:A disintegrin and metalloproteinase with thrombospondin motifs 17-like isoform X2 n=1 Tax=Conger conger TaxID=82655 RepID=UPI002A598771|nr:A disintegrin and metalloproteinase with thrombospondin motifs 17-like isoform X2 [Conger conger]
MTDSYIFQVILSVVILSARPNATTANNGDEAEMVVPLALSGSEFYLLQDASGRSWNRRRQRTAAESEIIQSDKDNLFLLLPAFGKELYLHVKRDARFLSKRFVIEEKNEGGISRLGHISDDQLCFYTGKVLNHTNSLASLSTCGGGLTGLVTAGNDSMFIEPVGDGQLFFSGVEHRVVRQRQHPKPSPPALRTHPKHCQPVPGRRKREVQNSSVPLSGDFTLETVVVVDADMVQYHGARPVQRFILTVMNMVHSMFQHQSLGYPINIRISKLLLLPSRPEGLKIRHHGERSLHSFCRWQDQEFSHVRNLGNNHIPGGRDGPPAVDVAILVTRTDFCVLKDEPCDTVGIAYLGGSCSSRRRCVLVEDNGFNLPFTIAHELGHSLGISHDDDHASCTSHSHIMSGEWVKGRNPSNLSWSNCSRGDLENFLRSEASACLLHTDPRGHTPARSPSKLPGMHYSVDEQCQILFGSNATFCRDMEHLMCAGLWCLVEGEGEECQTKLDPPLEGTECGTDKWCRAGSCVSKAPLPQHVDGDWGPWSSWSTCSRTCGTGARFRQRKCDNPPPGPTGRPCQGGSVEQQACQAPPCAKGVPTFRDQQCQSHGSKHSSSMWTAVINDEKPCALFCSPLGQEVPVLVAERVLDGTPCGPYETDLCVSGVCQPVGCDEIIGSLAAEDHCGLCGGDGQSCEVVKGHFNQSTGNGYTEAVVIPVGARRVKVEENMPSQGFLALKDSSNGSINSDWKIELPGEFQLAGTMVRYVRRGLWEKMSAKGPTKMPLHLMVLLFHGQAYSIQYEYTVSLNRSVSEAARPGGRQQGEAEQQEEPGLMYVWMHSRWENCSVQCGGGDRKTVVSCAVVANRTLSVVNDSYCHLENRPLPEVRRCHTHPCPAQWVPGAWGTCSVTCGAGLQVRDVVCVSQLQNGSYTRTLDWPCSRPKPPPTQGCEDRRCPAQWETSEWTKCSSKCGHGTRRRSVACNSLQDMCDSTSRPTEEEPCEDHTHCNEWQTGEWSKCSSTCGRGHQSRVVQCMHKVTGRHGNDCPIYFKPPASRRCSQGLCTKNMNALTQRPVALTLRPEALTQRPAALTQHPEALTQHPEALTQHSEALTQRPATLTQHPATLTQRPAALTQRCGRDRWAALCQLVREKQLCQVRRWHQDCCQTCQDLTTNTAPQNS